MIVGIITWLIVGLTVEFVASKLGNSRGDDPRFGIAVAVAGGLAGAPVSGESVRMWNPWSLLWAAMAAIVAAIPWHAIRSRFVSHERYVPRRSY